MKKTIISLSFCFWAFVLFAQNTNNSLKIGTFNIQNFGKTKLAKTAITDTLATIVRMFDVIAVQEISDASNHVASAFLDIVNDNKKHHYKLACSKRTGCQADDKSSQEQYVFYYNADVIKLVDTSLFDDSKHDFFQREPWVASFKTVKGNLSFVICTIHTTPELAVSEIGSLEQVAQWIPVRFNKSNNIIFCGDFNASCSYAKPEELANLTIHKDPYFWIIPDTAKTNLSEKKGCAYDRFVVTSALHSKVSDWAVVHYFKTTAVSDHWPVYITLKY